MKMYELYEAVLGVWDGFEKFFKNARSGSVFLLHFASYASYFRICEALKAVLSGFTILFMKIMKMYEGGVLNGFFAICPSFPAQDMKLENAVSSYKFINAPSPSPSPNGRAQFGEGSKLEVCCGV